LLYSNNLHDIDKHSLFFRSIDSVFINVEEWRKRKIKVERKKMRNVNIGERERERDME
jgi:hypothetical protein